jgi:hypothetical protein
MTRIGSPIIDGVSMELSHDLGLVASAADRLVVLQRGHVRAGQCPRDPRFSARRVHQATRVGGSDAGVGQDMGERQAGANRRRGQDGARANTELLS